MGHSDGARTGARGAGAAPAADDHPPWDAPGGELAAAVAGWALERWGPPLLAVDPRLAVRFANGAARALLADGARGAPPLRALERLGFREGSLEAAATRALDGGGASLVLGRATAARRGPAIAHVAPCAIGGADLAVVALADPPCLHPRGVRRVMDAFGLTWSEARVAVRVAAGTPPKEAADALGVRESTVRTHLKRIFEKLGCHSQADLARTLLLAPLPFE